MGIVTQEEWLRIICAAIGAVLPTTTWHAAFDSLGLLGNQGSMSETLCQELGLEVPPQVPRGLPSAAQAALVFPSRMKVDVMTCGAFCAEVGLEVPRSPSSSARARGIEASGLILGCSREFRRSF